MIIEINRIPSEGQSIEGEVSPDIIDINEEARFEKPLLVFVNVSIVSNMILVKGKITTEVELVCSRCAVDYTLKIEVSDFFFSKNLEGEEIIDLTPQIREDIIIALPVKPLCREDCKGICLKCGKDLNSGNCSCVLDKEASVWDTLDQLDL